MIANSYIHKAQLRFLSAPCVVRLIAEAQPAALLGTGIDNLPSKPLPSKPLGGGPHHEPNTSRS